MGTSGRSFERTTELPLNSRSTQGKRAAITGAVLALVAVAVYAVVVLKFMANG